MTMVGDLFFFTNGKPDELIQPARLVRRAQIARHQPASSDEDLEVKA